MSAWAWVGRVFAAVGRGLDVLVEDVPNTVRALLLVVTTTVGVAIVVLRGLVIPERFSRDAQNIQAIASGLSTSQGDDSFQNVAAVYRLLGLQHAPTLAGLFGYALALVALIIVFVGARGRTTWHGTAAMAVTILISAVYLGVYSKDLLVLAVALVVLLAPRGLIGDGSILIVIVAYAEFFRSYWFLVAALFVGMRLLLVLRRRWLIWAAPFVALLLLAVAAPLLTGYQSDFGRTSVNAVRGAASASTLIQPFVHLPAPLGSAVNTELVLLTTVVPVPLLLRGESYYVISAILIIAVWAGFFIGARHLHLTSRAMRSALVVLAFVTTQALFEPDYGSLVRHLAPLMPILCLVALAPNGGIGSAGGDRLADCLAALGHRFPGRARLRLRRRSRHGRRAA